jgi:3-hydroxyisobutyrate dehydrogenase
MAKLAFIGLGVMGGPMAGHLLSAGNSVVVWNRTSAKASALAGAGAKVAESPADAARGAEGVFVCVGDTPDVMDVLFGDDGVAHGLEPGALVVDCSTISPDAEIKAAGRLAAHRVRYLDAPVTGGQKGAAEGTLTFMIGGEARDIERARPWFMAMGKKIIHAGPLGCGQKLKIVNQVVCAIHLLALGEGFAAARTLGLDIRQAQELLISGAARSWTLEIYGEKVLNDDYTPGFSLKWQTKDIRIAMEALGSAGLDLPGLKAAYRQLNEAMARGYGDDGAHSVAKLYDRIMGRPDR